MRRNEKARQPREGAVTGPVGKPCVLAGSLDHPSTAGAAEHGPSRPAAIGADTADRSLAEARILIGVTSWLAAARDWFDAEAEHARDGHSLKAGNHAPAATVTLRLADVETFARSLANAVAHLDRLTVDRASAGALVAPVPPAAMDRRRLQ